MTDSQQSNPLLLKETFTLLKTYSLLRHSKKHGAENLVQAINRINLLRRKKIFNRLKTLGLIRKLSYMVTQSMRKVYYLIDYKLYANKKTAFDALKTFGRAKAKYFELKVAVQIPHRVSDKEKKAMLLKKNKAIAVMKIMNMLRKLSLYNQQTIKLFRKWQLEDLRNLVKEYEENNYLLLLTLKNLSVQNMVKTFDYIRKRTLQDALFTMFKNINSIEKARALKLTKLSNILLKKKVTDGTMTLYLWFRITFKRFFKSLAETHANEAKSEIKLLKAVNSICFSWKKTLAHNFMRFYRNCHSDHRSSPNGHLVNPPRSNIDNIQLKHLVSTLSTILFRRQIMAFGILKRESLNKYILNNDNNSDIELMQLQQEGTSLIAQVLKCKIKNSLKEAFYKIRTCSKLVIAKEKQQKEESKQSFATDYLIERDTIRTQAMIATYYEKRIMEIGMQTSTKKRQLLLNKILIRKLENVYQIKKTFFNNLRSLVSKLKLPSKLEKLEKKKELEAEKEKLTTKLNQLMNGNDEALQGTDPALKYLEFIENQHTELQLKFFKFLSIRKGGVSSP